MRVPSILSTVSQGRQKACNFVKHAFNGATTFVLFTKAEVKRAPERLNPELKQNVSPVLKPKLKASYLVALTTLRHMGWNLIEQGGPNMGPLFSHWQDGLEETFDHLLTTHHIPAGAMRPMEQVFHWILNFTM